MKQSFRSRFRAFQAMRTDEVDPAFVADLEFVENRDLDLSVRLGAMLGFNALLITVGTHPISASPGAPLSLDATTHPLLTWASLIGILPYAFASYCCLRALLLGEEFDSDNLEGRDAYRRALFAAFVHSIDVQQKSLSIAIRSTILGGVMTMSVWVWILLDKML